MSRTTTISSNTSACPSSLNRFSGVDSSVMRASIRPPQQRLTTPSSQFNYQNSATYNFQTISQVQTAMRSSVHSNSNFNSNTNDYKNQTRSHVRSARRSQTSTMIYFPLEVARDECNSLSISQIGPRGERSQVSGITNYYLASADFVYSADGQVPDSRPGAWRNSLRCQEVVPGILQIGSGIVNCDGRILRAVQMAKHPVPGQGHGGNHSVSILVKYTNL